MRFCCPTRPGEAFRCYSCERPTPIYACRNITSCKLEDTACKTTLEKVENGEAGPRAGPQHRVGPPLPKASLGAPRLPLAWEAEGRKSRAEASHLKGCLQQGKLSAPGPESGVTVLRLE